MADSENSTSLPVVTRRDFLIVPLLVSIKQHRSQASIAASEVIRSDPISSIWREWFAAHQQTASCCRRQQQLERALVEEVGFAEILVTLPGETQPSVLNSKADLELLMEEAPESASIYREAIAALTEHHARWDAVDQRIGYSEAISAEEEAARRERELFEALCAAPAHTIGGIAAKLEAILQEGEWCEGCQEFPWPQIRGVLRDVAAIEGLLRCAGG